ncbi:MAG: relaxase domain-containing protein [Verrucomicrobia bacterium]|nr:relaxase domain-containing protein [Verrucomicrobiota bacterium]
MLTAKAQYSLANAKQYFDEHLRVGDYYAQGQQVLGQWHGQGGEMLELTGITQAEQFLRLCENLHPQTGERLTLRQKTTRTDTGPDGQEHERANRRLFYDFRFSPPKSVSIAALVADDRRIVEAHERAVAAALDQLQAFAATRVRKSGQCADRLTGNLVTAVFRHETSRALDPHLHSHCIVFNATFDPVERQWKALQNHEMLAAQKFVENVYYHQLARELRTFGYQIENRPRGDFEIQDVSAALIEKFSKRRREIDQQTRELLAREPEKADANLAAIRDYIAHRERARKIKEVGLARLRMLWEGQMTPTERESLAQLASGPPCAFEAGNQLAVKAVVWAEEHLFERESVVHEHEIWRRALEYARGQNLLVSDIQAVARQRGYLSYNDQPGKITRREILQREWAIVALTSNGFREFHPFVFDYENRNPQLDGEQRQAVEKILRSRDFVTLFRGAAGTGKSFALREVQRELRRAGREVLVIAPQRQQVMDLERDGFANVETVSAYLARAAMPPVGVVIVDEAGQIGGRQMHALLRLVKENRGRLILSGDTRQHGAVAATDALLAIEKYSGLRPIELTNVRRQNPALARSGAERRRIREYRQAVVEARDGKLAESFNRLDKLGAIISCTPADRHEKLTARYLELARARQSRVVVSQSWDEIHRVNEAIRAALQREKLVGEAETVVTIFRPVNLTEAQKRDSRSFTDNSVVVFNRDFRGLKAGAAGRLWALTDSRLVVESDDRVVAVPFRNLDRITVCERKELALSAGDRLQLKANGRSVEGRKLANGELVVVKAIPEDGRIRLTDGRTLGPGFRQFVRGYAVTSYASQGKSVDHVLFSDSAVKASTSDQQWYVTISRGRKGVHIFTTDKAQLRENILRRGDRPLAVDLVPGGLRRSWFYRLVERQWGGQLAQIMERKRRTRISAALRQRAAQHRSHGIGTGI